jgi:hypothetical protein
MNKPVQSIDSYYTYPIVNAMRKHLNVTIRTSQGKQYLSIKQQLLGEIMIEIAEGKMKDE